jgi:hypothetical protein
MGGLGSRLTPAGSAVARFERDRSMRILTIDVGGTHVKFLATGQNEKREILSGKHLTAAAMAREVLARTGDWDYEAVSIGYPGLADHKGPRADPEYLGDGWVGFDFAAAFGRPVKVLNDAAMQAVGSYEGGRMLFLGLGTAVGSALISERTVVPLELGWAGPLAVDPALGSPGRARRVDLNDYGFYGELANAPASLVAHHPPSLSWAEAAAAWMQYMTAYGALIDVAGLRPGETVVSCSA